MNKNNAFMERRLCNYLFLLMNKVCVKTSKQIKKCLLVIYFSHSKLSKNPRVLDFCKIFRNPATPRPQTSLFYIFLLTCRYLKEIRILTTPTESILFKFPVDSPKLFARSEKLKTVEKITLD